MSNIEFRRSINQSAYAVIAIMITVLLVCYGIYKATEIMQ